MGISFSEDQQKAIYAENKNVLVSAAAGSGKTAVLVERIIKKISDESKGTDIDRLLVVTFTKAAASEMRERIGRTLLHALSEDPENERLQMQYTLMHKSSISTIDAFCNNVVKKYFHLTTLDPDYRIANEDDVQPLRDAAMNELLEERYEKATESFMKVDALFVTETKDTQLADLIWKIYIFSQSLPHPAKWLDECAESFNLGDKSIFQSVWGDCITAEIKEILVGYKGYIDSIEKYSNVCDTQIPGVEKILKVHTDKYINLSNELEKGVLPFLKLYGEIGSDFGTLRFGKDVDEYDKAFFKAMNDGAKKTIKKIDDYCTMDFETEENWVKDMYDVVKEIADLVKSFAASYRYKKFEKQLVEFDDIKHLCVDILIDKDGKRTDAAKELGDYYKEIIVDEYQDSDYIQESIFSAISGEGENANNIFMVGDIKQSIYKFRNAVPELFAGKYKTYSKKDEAEERLIMLSGNYRSRACVLDSCNFFFNQLMSEEVGDVDYNDDVALVTKGSFPEAEDGIKISDKSELYIIKSPARTAENFDGAEDLEKTELEASLAAKRIIELLSDEDFRIVDKSSGKYRRPVPGDVAILMRSPGRDAATVSEVLSKYGIATTSVGEDSVFKTVEVQTIVSILRVICNPLNDIELIAALHSSIYSLNCDELAVVKMYSNEKYYYYNIKNYLKDHDNETAKKIKRFLLDIDHYRDFYSHESVSDLIQEIYDKSGYYSFVGALPNGNLKRINLQSLFDVALRFEGMGGFDLGDFLNYVDTLTQNNSIARAAVVKEAQNTVKVMSFHASKGLEFPIVILLRTEKQFNFDDITKRNIIYHSQLGIAFDKFDTEDRIKSPSLIKSVVGNIKKSEIRSEELRLLYVAMTRAKEKLIMIGCSTQAKDSDVKMQKYLLETGDKLPFYDCKNSNNTMYWLKLAAVRQREFYDKYMRGAPHGKLYENIPLEIYFWDKTEAIEYINSSYDELLEKTKLITKVSKESHDPDKQEIMYMINYLYDKVAAYHVPSGMSISEIKRQHTAELKGKPAEFIMPALEEPEFRRKGKKKVTGAQRGTAYHKVFENLDFDVECSDEYLDKLLVRLVKLHLLEEEAVETIDKEKIKAFASSEMIPRIKKAIKVYRERDFAMRMSAADAYDDDAYLPSNAYLMVRGVIDLYFEEEDGLVLIDYKTDKQEDAEYYINTYDIQLELYKRALEKSTGKKVKEIYIYALNVPGGFIKI